MSFVILFTLATLLVHDVHSAPGLCTGNVVLTIGVDPGIGSSSCIAAIIEATAVNRSTTIGYTVTINQLKIASTTLAQTVVNDNADGVYSPVLTGFVFDPQGEPLQSGTVPVEFVAFPAVARYAKCKKTKNNLMKIHFFIKIDCLKRFRIR